jgi:hypothetical protein
MYFPQLQRCFISDGHFCQILRRKDIKKIILCRSKLYLQRRLKNITVSPFALSFYCLLDIASVANIVTHLVQSASLVQNADLQSGLCEHKMSELIKSSEKGLYVTAYYTNQENLRLGGMNEGGLALLINYGRFERSSKETRRG